MNRLTKDRLFSATLLSITVLYFSAFVCALWLSGDLPPCEEWKTVQTVTYNVALKMPIVSHTKRCVKRASTPKENP